MKFGYLKLYFKLLSNIGYMIAGKKSGGTDAFSCKSIRQKLYVNGTCHNKKDELY